jgi:phage terminase small subunit
MPALTNPKHERFAQELASGKTAEAAHGLAGYKASRSGASQLRQNINISNRVAEILKQREFIHGQATAEAIKSAALTKQWVIEQLMTVSERTMQARPVLDRKGAPVMVETPSGSLAPAFIFDSSGANRSLELLGKELGMFVDRSISENVNTNYVVAADPIGNVEDWEAEHTAKH